MKSILTVLFLVVSFAAGMAIFAALYFAAIFAFGDYMLGVNFNDQSVQALGRRVGAAASVIGGVIGAVLGMAFGADWVKHLGGGTNWSACVFGGLVTAAIVIGLLFGGSVNAFWAIVHYKIFGYAALFGFSGLTGWIAKTLKVET